MKKGLRRGLTAIFLAAAAIGAVAGIRILTSGPSQPAQSASSLFHHYSTATGNDVTPEAVQPAAGECPVEVVTLKGKFTIAGKSFKPYSATLDNITAANLATAPLYGFSTTSPSIEKTINTAENNPALALKVTIKNLVPNDNGCTASSLTIAGQIVSAKIVTPSSGPRA